MMEHLKLLLKLKPNYVRFFEKYTYVWFSLSVYEEGKSYIRNTVRYIPIYCSSFARSRNTTYTYSLFNHTRLMTYWASTTASRPCFCHPNPSSIWYDWIDCTYTYYLYYVQMRNDMLEYISPSSVNNYF